MIIKSSFSIGDRTSCRPIQSVIILKTNQTPASRSSDFNNHLHDYRPNWTPLSPVAIINRLNEFSISVNMIAYGLERFSLSESNWFPLTTRKAWLKRKKTLAPPFTQSAVKLKPIVTCSLTLSRALRQLYAIFEV